MAGQIPAAKHTRQGRAGEPRAPVGASGLPGPSREWDSPQGRQLLASRPPRGQRGPGAAAGPCAERAAALPRVGAGRGQPPPHPPWPTSPPGVTPWRGPWGAGDTETFGMHSGSRWGPERCHPAASSTKTRLRARKRGNETPLNAPRRPPKDLGVPRLGPVSCTRWQPPGFQQATLAPMQCWCPCNTPVQRLHPCNVGTHAALVPMQCTHATLAPCNSSAHAMLAPMQHLHPCNAGAHATRLCRAGTCATPLPMQCWHPCHAPVQPECPCNAPAQR